MVASSSGVPTSPSAAPFSMSSVRSWLRSARVPVNTAVLASASRNSGDTSVRASSSRGDVRIRSRKLSSWARNSWLKVSMSPAMPANSSSRPRRAMTASWTTVLRSSAGSAVMKSLAVSSTSLISGGVAFSAAGTSPPSGTGSPVPPSVGVNSTRCSPTALARMTLGLDVVGDGHAGVEGDGDLDPVVGQLDRVDRADHDAVEAGAEARQQAGGVVEGRARPRGRSGRGCPAG